MEAIGYIIAAVVAAILLVAMQPRTAKQKRPSLEDFSIPRANQGDPIPWVFGEVTITGSTVTWYGNLLVEPETEDGVVTRRFYMGLHFTPCYGPVDALKNIYAGERDVWEGEVTESGTISISQGSLFGGKRLQGGIVGDVDVMMGESTQTANAYLSAVQGTPQPAYRGLLSLVANQIYISANVTQIEPWAFRLRRIVSDWYGGECWYEATAIVGAGGAAETDALVYAPFTDYVYDPYYPLPNSTDTKITHIYGLYDFDTFLGSAGSYTNIASVTATAVYNYGYALRCRRSQSDYAGMLADGTGLTLTHSDQGSDDLTLPGDFSGMFFPDKIGKIEVRFACNTYITTTPHPDLVPCVLSCGFDYNIGPTDSDYYYMWAWAFFLQDEKLLDAPEAQWNGVSYDANTSDYAYVIFSWIDSSYVKYTVNLGKVLKTADVRARIEMVATETPGVSTMNAYLNGVLAATSTMSTAMNVYTGTEGNSNDGPHIRAGQFLGHGLGESKWDGWIDYVTVWPGWVDTTGYMNPAHIIYQALTDPRGMGEPTSRIDDDSFRAAADTFYNEGMGLCLQWLRQEKIEEFVQHICDHAACVLRANPRTGKWNLKPIRADYEAGDLTVYDEDDIVAVESWERVGYGELVGEVTITYRDVETNKDAAVTLQNLAVIQAQSGIVTESLSLPGIPTQSLASRVCMRELKARSVPLARVKFKAKRTAWELLPGDVFKLSWDKLGLSEVIMRVVAVDTGTLTDHTVTVEATEDVYGMPSSTYAATQASGWTDPVAVETGDVDQSVVRAWEDATQRRTEENQVRMTE